MAAKAGKRVRRFGLSGAIMALVFLLLVLATAFFAMSRYFVISRIDVAGAEGDDAQRVINASGLMLGQSMFRVDEREVEIALAADGYIHFGGLSRQWPGTVVLNAEICRPFACAEHLGHRYVLDRELRVLEYQGAGGESPVELIKISGLKLQQTPVGSALNCDQGVVRALKSLAAALINADLAQNIDNIDIPDVYNISVHTKNGFVFRLGDGSAIDQKVAWIRDLEPRLISEGKTGGTIDVTTGIYADYSAPAATAQPTQPPSLSTEKPVDLLQYLN